MVQLAHDIFEDLKGRQTITPEAKKIFDHFFDGIGELKDVIDNLQVVKTNDQPPRTG